MADKRIDASKIDALYSWLSYDLQTMKAELLKELKYSSVQVGSLYQEMKADKDRSSQAISQEIRYSYKQNQTIYDGLSSMINNDFAKKLEAIDEKAGMLDGIRGKVADVAEKVAALENVDTDTLAETLKNKLAEVIAQLEESFSEVKYAYMQQQAIYDGLATLISGEVVTKLDDVQAKAVILEEIDRTLNELNVKAVEVEAAVLDSSRQTAESLASLPVNDNVDYNRIVDEVGDKLLDLLAEIGLGEPVSAEPTGPVEVQIDYDKIVYGTAEKVVESLPLPDKIDYRRIDNSFAKAAQNVNVNLNEELLSSVISTAVEKALASLDVDAIASKVAEKISLPVVEVPEVDYERLADLVAERLAAKERKQAELGEETIDRIAEKVLANVPKTEVPEFDYDRIAAIVEEKLANQPKEEATYELVLDEEGVQAIASTVSQEICEMCSVCEEKTPVEEASQDGAEEETFETPVEEAEPAPAEEAVTDEELAVAEEPVDETGLVVRKKKSFTAKIKQSEEAVKSYYSNLKNELTSYKKINSNVSWHGDRFNYGRDTVAKVNICGKTLCFYLALDPEDPELKSTVYHQKDVGGQKAYESTPFMVKVKSDAAAKKALRLVGYLADKLGAEKEEEFTPFDYVGELAYEDDDALEAAGHIKSTKEKKVDLDF